MLNITYDPARPVEKGQYYVELIDLNVGINYNRRRDFKDGTLHKKQTKQNLDKINILW